MRDGARGVAGSGGVCACLGLGVGLESLQALHARFDVMTVGAQTSEIAHGAKGFAIRLHMVALE